MEINTKALLLCIFRGFLEIDGHKAEIGYIENELCCHISAYFVTKDKIIKYTFNKIELKKMLGTKLTLEMFDFFRFIYLANNFINDIY
jgi:intracellular septation protein A